MSARPELHAPKEDGAVLAEPPLTTAGELLNRNRQLLESVKNTLLGRSWPELRREARADALIAARRYHAAAREPAPSFENSDAIVIAGHQPELFHSGVWVKNFALAGLARHHGVTAINLVVDNDTVKSTALRLPSPATKAVAWPHTVTVPFDRWTGEAPYEERLIQDREEFAGFASRANAVLAKYDYEPLLTKFWPEVLRQAKDTPLMGECFARTRRTFEKHWGCHNLELPISALCQTGSFAWFACHLLSDLPRFHAIYNDCVHDYRKSHQIRSRNHPVPDLAADGDWLETPFWGWRAGESRRGRLFARVSRDTIFLRVGEKAWPAIPAENGKRATEVWQSLETEGYKVRCRALTNTLFSRLFLGDLFIHGIGGGKYDELTDAIIHRFYDIEPPAFIVLTATCLLPLPHFPAQSADCHRLQQMTRDIHWNPQRHLDANDRHLQEAIRQREEWVQREPTDKVSRKARYQALREWTERLRTSVADKEKQLRAQLATCEKQVEANAILTRRDYSFVLHPEAILRPFCSQFL